LSNVEEVIKEKILKIIENIVRSKKPISENEIEQIINKNFLEFVDRERLQ